MSLRDLYQEVILDHNQSPRNYGELEPCTIRRDGDNPLCGDNIILYLIIEDEKISDIDCEKIVEIFNLSLDAKKQAINLIKSIYKMFIDTDANLVEITPLILPDLVVISLTLSGENNCAPFPCAAVNQLNTMQVTSI